MSLIIVIIVGALIGLLLNYLADVLPQTSRISHPVCRNCEHPFTLKEYLFSFRCPECKKSPGKRYWITLILSILVSVALAFFPLKHFTYWQSLPLVAFLGLIFIIDIEHHSVLLGTDVVGFLLGIIYGLKIHSPLEVFLGGITAAAAMLVLFYGGVLFNRILGKMRHQPIEEVALGFGDVIVCSYLGLIAGLSHVAGLLILTILFSGAFALLYIVVKLITRKYSAFSAVAYAPFMILALITLFYI